MGANIPIAKQPWEMTKEERVAEIAQLRAKNRGVLATPLMSEGEISSYQVGSMGPQQRARWDKNSMLRMDIESRIRILESDERIASLKAKAEAALVEDKARTTWLWPRDEWVANQLAQKPSSLSHLTEKEFAKFEAKRHAKGVKWAVEHSKPVPPEVLKDYPDLEGSPLGVAGAEGRLEALKSLRLVRENEGIRKVVEAAEAKLLQKAGLEGTPPGVKPGGKMKPRIQIRPSYSQGQKGFVISGQDALERRIDIFVQTRKEAEKVRDRIKAGKEGFPSKTELTTKQATRTLKAKAVDNSIQAPIGTYEQWMQKPNRYDLPGIDLPEPNKKRDRTFSRRRKF